MGQEMGRGSDKEDRGSYVDCRREAAEASSAEEV